MTWKEETMMSLISEKSPAEGKMGRVVGGGKSKGGTREEKDDVTVGESAEGENRIVSGRRAEWGRSCEGGVGCRRRGGSIKVRSSLGKR